MSEGIVELDLRATPPPPFTLGAMLPHLERILQVTAEALRPDHPGLDPDPLQAHIIELRAALAGTPDPVQVHGLANALLIACADALDRQKRDRTSVRDEIAQMVALVHSITKTVAGETQAFTTEMADQAARLEALHEINDIGELKAHLSKEVGRLKEVTQAREDRWKTVSTTFQTRIETLEQQLQQTQQEATVDALTGAANRRAFDRALQGVIASQSRKMSVVLVDVDDFKQVNDSEGHEAGDKVLQAVVQVVTESVRSDDVVARLGGDEFAVLFKGMGLLQTANRMSDVSATLAVGNPETGRPPISVSCGVAEYSPGDTMQSLVKRAGKALYDAKRQGKQRVATRAVPVLREPSHTLG